MMNNSIKQIKQLKELFEGEFKPVGGIQKNMSSKDKLLIEIADNIIEQDISMKCGEDLKEIYTVIEADQVWRNKIDGVQCLVEELDSNAGIKIYRNGLGSIWIDSDTMIKQFELVTMENMQPGEWYYFHDSECRKTNQYNGEEHFIDMLKEDGCKFGPCLPPTKENDFKHIIEPKKTFRYDPNQNPFRFPNIDDGGWFVNQELCYDSIVKENQIWIGETYYKILSIESDRARVIDSDSDKEYLLLKNIKKFSKLVTMNNIEKDGYVICVNDVSLIGLVEIDDLLKVIERYDDYIHLYNEKSGHIILKVGEFDYFKPCLPPTEEKETTEFSECASEWLDIRSVTFELPGFYNQEDMDTAIQSTKDENEYLRECIDKLTFSIDKVKRTEYARGCAEISNKSYDLIEKGRIAGYNEAVDTIESRMKELRFLKLQD